MPRVIFRKRDPLSKRIYRSPYTHENFVTVYGYELCPGDAFEQRYWASDGHFVCATRCRVLKTHEGKVIYWEDVPISTPLGEIRTKCAKGKFMKLV